MILFWVLALLLKVLVKGSKTTRALITSSIFYSQMQKFHQRPLKEMTRMELCDFAYFAHGPAIGGWSSHEVDIWSHTEELMCALCI